MDAPGEFGREGPAAAAANGQDDGRAGTDPASVAALHAEIHDLRAQLAIAAAHATFDPVTCLPNRAHFSAQLTQLSAACLAAGTSAFVMVIGVDRLTMIRESMGFDIADAVTRRIGDRLRDAAPADARLARIGDNAFALALPMQADAVSAGTDPDQLADRLIAVIDSPIRVGEDDLRLLASIGIARFPADGMHTDLLLAHAHGALHFARDHGTRTHEFFTPTIAAQGGRLLRLEAELHRGLDRGEFRVHYQPRRSLQDRRIVGLEALLRWDHPERGLLAAVDFVDVAVQSGLITPIGESVLHQACHDAMQWPSHIALSVNLSAREFRGTRLETIIDDALCQSGLRAQRFHLELTEASLRGSGSLVNDEIDVSLIRLTALRERGIRIVLDNFGRAVSGPDLLRRCRADYVKIDARLIRALDHDPDARVVVRSVANLARHFGATIIGEGIEDAAQAAAAADAGCTQGQGYFLGRPLTQARLLGILQVMPELVA